MARLRLIELHVSTLPYGEREGSHNHQEIQPKMEGLNLKRLFWGWGFPYISLTAYIDEYLHLRYLKILMTQLKQTVRKVSRVTNYYLYIGQKFLILRVNLD